MTAEPDQPTAADAAHVTTTPRVPIRVQAPASLLAIIPHLLGFHPVSSLVIIGTDQARHKFRVALRYDLPDPPDPRAADEISQHAEGVLVAQDSTRTFVVGYGPGHLVTPIIEKVQETWPPAGLTLTELLRVEDGRYWSYLCDQPGCCPADGTPFDVNADPVAAAFAASGSRVLASREALAGTVAAVIGKTAALMRQATRRAEERSARLDTQTIVATGLDTVAKAIERYRSGGQLSPGIDAAWLALVLRDWRVRDDAWSQMVPEHCAAHRKLWTDLTRLARPGYVAASASLLAFVAWESGNGALANVALDRALADDPQYSMARLLVREAGGLSLT